MVHNIKCPYCDTLLTKKKYCNVCGEDTSLFKKAVVSSCGYYNSGLAKAKVRDLSGAVEDLKKSLQLYKNNIDARNLLGLVYYEMGDIVQALTEWVLSKNFQPKKNELADFYINDIQSNPTKLENYNQAIKKYNSALLSAQQESEDLAIIQLKKVVALNPKFLKAMHLLALLYIKTNERERAHRILVKAAKIDIANTTTLRYLAELGYKNDGPDTVAVSYTNDDKSAGSFTTGDLYGENKPNVMAFVNLIIGIVVGLAVAAFLIVPAVKENAAKKYTSDSSEYNELVSQKNSEIKALETDKESLEDQLKDVNTQLEELKAQDQNAKDTSESYTNILNAINSYMDEDYEKTAAYMKKVDLSLIEDKTVTGIYNSMKENVVSTLYEKGHDKYTNGDYEEALTIFKRIYGIDKQNPDAMYFLARSFDKTDDTEMAKKMYQYVIDTFPDDKRASEAQTKLSSIS